MEVEEIMMLIKGVPEVWYNGKERVISFNTWMTVGNYINMTEVRQLQGRIWDQGRKRTTNIKFTVQYCLNRACGILQNQVRDPGGLKSGPKQQHDQIWG